MHSMLNLEKDELQQQRTEESSTAVSREQDERLLTQSCQKWIQNVYPDLQNLSFFRRLKWLDSSNMSPCIQFQNNIEYF